MGALMGTPKTANDIIVIVESTMGVKTLLAR